MIVKIFTYLDKLVHIVKPQQLLFMAIDGSAPRAKMNQQRARRFKSAREAAEAAEAAARRGDPLPDPETRFDSNCITPGTRETAASEAVGGLEVGWLYAEQLPLPAPLVSQSQLLLLQSCRPSATHAAWAAGAPPPVPPWVLSALTRC